MARQPAPLPFRDFAAFYEWLEQHHATAKGARLVLHKKKFQHQGIGYEDAVRAALCWGWIDSTTWRQDDERFVQRFSPRRRGSNWSASNIRRMRELLADKLVTPAGLAVFDRQLIERLGKVEATEKARREAPAVLPSPAAALLADAPDATAAFEGLPPSHRRQYCQWIAAAKREDTKVRRTRKMIQMLRDGRQVSEL